MRNFFKTLQRDSVLRWSFWITLFIILLIIIVITLFYTNLPPYLPLYNQLPWGYSRLGHTYELFLLPLTLLIVMVVDTTIGIRLIGNIPLLARFLFLTMLILSLFTFIFIGRIVFLVL